MASMSTIVPLCLSLLLFFQVSIAQFSFGGGPLYSSRGFRGDSVSQHQCRFEHLAALKVTHRDRSEAGFIEYYNTEVRNEFRCAGVSVRRLVIESRGLALPVYANAHKLLYIIQGLYTIVQHIMCVHTTSCFRTTLLFTTCEFF